MMRHATKIITMIEGIKIIMTTIVMGRVMIRKMIKCQKRLVNKRGRWKRIESVPYVSLSIVPSICNHPILVVRSTRLSLTKETLDSLE